MRRLLGSWKGFGLAALLLSAVYLSGCDSAADRAQSHYERGVELAAEGEPVKASLEFRNALRLKGDFNEALYALGEVEEAQANFQGAYSAYLSLSEQDPKHVKARVRLAYLLLAAGQLDAALEFADAAIAIDENDAGALTAKAATELRLDNRGEAIQLARAALQQSPEFVDAFIVLASERLMASDPAGALTFLDSAGGDTERNLGLQILRLTALDALDDQPGVEQLFAKLTELFPDTQVFQQGLVRWYLSKGRNADAERVMRQFAADNPDDDQAQLGLVSFLNAQGGSETAIAELQTIIAARGTENGKSLDLRMALARLQFAAGDQSTAMDLVQSLVSETSTEDDRNRARVLLARMAVAAGDVPRAEDLADAVLDADAKNVDALSIRASIRLQAGDDAAAIDDLRAALNEAPDNVGLHGLLAQAYEADGSAVLAEEQYARALALDHNSAESGLPMARFLLRYGRTDDASRVLESVRQQAPGDSRVLTLLAQLKLATQDWVGAQEIANTLRRLEQGGGETTADRIAAAALGGLNKNSESINLLQTLLSDAGSRQAVLPDLIRAYVRAGRLEAAAAYLQTVIDEDPADVQAYILLGSVYMNAGNEDQARATLEQAAAVDTGVLGQTALAQFHLAQGNLEEADKAVRTGLERDAESAALRLLLATILERSEDFDGAIDQYEILFEADPNSTLAANNLASLLSERRGDQESLDRAFEIAQRFRNSDIPQYLDTLGWIYYLRGEYAPALPLLKSAAERLPNVALTQYHQGMVLQQLGQTELAAESLERSISLTPPLIASDLAKAQNTLAEIRGSGQPAEEVPE